MDIKYFPATCSALNSAIKKLAKKTPLPSARKLYRGLSGMDAEEAQLPGPRLRALLHDTQKCVLASKIKVLELSDVAPEDAEWFNDPAHFKDIICRLVDAYSEDLRDAAQLVLPAGRDSANAAVDRLEALKSGVQLLRKSASTDEDSSHQLVLLLLLLLFIPSTVSVCESLSRAHAHAVPLRSLSPALWLFPCAQASSP